MISAAIALSALTIMEILQVFVSGEEGDNSNGCSVSDNYNGIESEAYLYRVSIKIFSEIKQEETKMTCPRCGTPTEPGAGFCPSCGASLIAPMNAPVQQPLPALAKKGNKKLLIIAVVAIVIVVALVAIIFAVPSLNGSGNISTNYAPKNGDYIEYNVTGLASTITLSGTARLDITNVTSTGFDMVITYTGIPGATTATEHYDLSDSGSVNYGYGVNGVKVDTEKIQTPWGLKTVDKYYEQTGTGNVTGYVGSEAQLPFRIDIQGDGFFMTLLIASTNIDVIENAN